MRLLAGSKIPNTFLYLAALFHLPFANVSAINQSSPLFIALLAMVLLKERVDTGRWIAIGIGFLGVLAVIQPRLDGFNLYAWMTLLATFSFACRDLLTRKVPMATPSILVTLTTASVVWMMACGVLAVQGWTPMSAGDVGLLSIAAVLLSTAYYASIAAMRQGGDVGGRALPVCGPFLGPADRLVRLGRPAECMGPHRDQPADCDRRLHDPPPAGCGSRMSAASRRLATRGTPRG